MTDKRDRNQARRPAPRRIPLFPREALSEQWLREHPPKTKRR